jgi:hypothetical protein
MAIPRLLMPKPEKVARLTTEIQEKLGALPGVTSVGFASAVPMDNSSPDWDGSFAEGHTFAGSYPPMRTFRFAGPEFFSTMKTSLVAGREYTWDDFYNQRQYVMISENLAREFWGAHRTPSESASAQIQMRPGGK